MNYEEAEKFFKEEQQRRGEATAQRIKDEQKQISRAEFFKKEKGNASPLSYEKKNNKDERVEEIIEHGTTKQRAALAVVSVDINRFIRKGGLSAEQRKRLVNKMYEAPKKEQEKYTFYIEEARKMMRYADKVNFAFKVFQTEVGYLSQYLIAWDKYEEEAKACTEILCKFENEKEELYIKIKEALLSSHSTWEGAALSFNEEKKEFFVNVYVEGSLLKSIFASTEDLQNALIYFKTLAEAGEDYIWETAPFCEPYSMEMIIENAREERFVRALCSPCYLRSVIRIREESGEEVPAEEHFRAIIPDYYALPINEELYKTMIDKLKNNKI